MATKYGFGKWMLLFACTSAAIAAQPEAVEMESDWLKTVILPSSSGRVSSLVDKRTGIEHLEPLIEREISFSPLVPSTLESNMAGIKDWLWGVVSISPKIPFEVLERGRNEEGQWVVLQGAVDGIDVKKKITLSNTKPVLLFEVTLTTPKERKASYWAHSVTRADAYLSEDRLSGWVAGNFSTDDRARQGRGIVKLDNPGPRVFVTHLSDYAFNPEQPWFARILADQSGGLMLVVDSTFMEGEDGFFYTWQNRSTTSLEAVWPSMNLKPGEPVTLCYLYQPFLLEESEMNGVDESGRKAHEMLIGKDNFH